MPPLSNDDQIEALAAYEKAVGNGIMTRPQWNDNDSPCRLDFMHNTAVEGTRETDEEDWWFNDDIAPHVALCILQAAAMEELDQQSCKIDLNPNGKAVGVWHCGRQESSFFDLGNIHLNLIAALQWAQSTKGAKDEV